MISKYVNHSVSEFMQSMWNFFEFFGWKPSLPRNGYSLWSRIAGRLGKETALDKLVYGFGQKRLKGRWFYESNESLASRTMRHLGHPPSGKLTPHDVPRLFKDITGCDLRLDKYEKDGLAQYRKDK